MATPDPGLEVYRSTTQHLLTQISSTLTPANMNQLDSHVNTLIHLLSRDDKDFVPSDRLPVLADLPYNKISDTNNPSWSKTGAHVVHKLNHALYPTLVEVDCCRATPNDMHPHYQLTNVVFMMEIYDKCFEKMMTDLVTGDLLPTAAAGTDWHAGLFEFLAHLYTVGCKGGFPLSLVDTLFKGMASSTQLFLPQNWVICTEFVEEVNEEMRDAGGEAKMLLWSFMKELIGRVLVEHGSHDVAGFVPPKDGQVRDVAAMTGWLNQNE